MQIVDLYRSAWSIHLFPSFPDVITLHHTVISLFLSTLPLVIAPPLFNFLTCQHETCVCVCVHFLMCAGKDLSGQWC